ncbi:unnamed protein product, partial [Ectocarpus sp. 12 AP-2014]
EFSNLLGRRSDGPTRSGHAFVSAAGEIPVFWGLRNGTATSRERQTNPLMGDAPRRNSRTADGRTQGNGFPAAAAAETASTTSTEQQGPRPRTSSPSPMPPAVGVDDAKLKGGRNGSHEDGTSRTSSAYILLQLRDLGRRSSIPSNGTPAAASVEPGASGGGGGGPVSTSAAFPSTVVDSSPRAAPYPSSAQHHQANLYQQQPPRNEHSPPPYPPAAG